MPPCWATICILLANSRRSCEALNGVPIKKTKIVNLMNKQNSTFTEKTKGNLNWACGVAADYIIASFIWTSGNVRPIIAYLYQCILELPEVDGKPKMRPLIILKSNNKNI